MLEVGVFNTYEHRLILLGELPGAALIGRVASTCYNDAINHLISEIGFGKMPIQHRPRNRDLHSSRAILARNPKSVGIEAHRCRIEKF